MNQIKKIMVLSLVALCVLSGCANNDLARERAKKAGTGNDIVIGVPVPLKFAQENTCFLKGMDLALKDINAQGINGKKIRLEIADDRGNFKTAVDTAQKFCENTQMTAVIGHWYSDICIPVSKIYEEAGMLTIVPTVSNPEVTDKGYKYIFQSISNDKKIAQEMCAYAKSKGYRKVVICYEESSYGENLANAIEKESQIKGLKIVDRCSGLVTEEQFKQYNDKWQALDFDAVLLALNMPEGATFIKQLRNLNDQIGIISADGLDVSNFLDELGPQADGVVIATTYSPYSESSELKSFTRKYQEKYKEQPDVWAIQGYESLTLIAHAIKETNSCSPKILSDYLHTMKPYKTVSGAISFNQSGEIQGRTIYTKMVVDGAFKYVD
jgi:branched-chain amino acid transport system substrate-binding protein